MGVQGATAIVKFVTRFFLYGRPDHSHVVFQCQLQPFKAARSLYCNSLSLSASISLSLPISICMLRFSLSIHCIALPRLLDVARPKMIKCVGDLQTTNYSVLTHVELQRGPCIESWESGKNIEETRTELS